jgi:hypothetical protein
MNGLRNSTLPIHGHLQRHPCFRILLIGSLATRLESIFFKNQSHFPDGLPSVINASKFKKRREKQSQVYRKQPKHPSDLLLVDF